MGAQPRPTLPRALTLLLVLALHSLETGGECGPTGVAPTPRPACLGPLC